MMVNLRGSAGFLDGISGFGILDAEGYSIAANVIRNEVS